MHAAALLTLPRLHPAAHPQAGHAASGHAAPGHASHGRPASWLAAGHAAAGRPAPWLPPAAAAVNAAARQALQWGGAAGQMLSS